MPLDPLIEGLLQKNTWPTPAELRATLMAMRVMPDLSLVPLPENDTQPYTKVSLATTDFIEVMLVCWLPNKITAPHDHGQSFCVVKLLTGHLSNTLFDVNQQILVPREQHTYKTNDIHYVPAGQIHAEGSLTHDLGYSLHLYVPPIQNMRVYDLDTNQGHIVTKGAGAWTPNTQ